MRRLFSVLCCSFALSACMTVAYSSARDPAMVKAWPVTITEISEAGVYSPMAVSLVGPFAALMDHRKGDRLQLMDDTTGDKFEIVQPQTTLYQLRAGQHARYVVDRGQVWVQPLDYPLPPEFSR